MRDEASCSWVGSYKSVMVQWSTLVLSFALLVIHRSEGTPEVFTNSFLVKFNGPHGHELANVIAKRNGFENLGSVSTEQIFAITYLFN